MMKKFLPILCLISVCLTNCKQQSDISADDIAISWRMIENTYKGKGQFKSSLTFVNTGKGSLKNDWTVYFNFVRRIDQQNVTGNVEITHINGDFYSLSPKNNFQLASGDSVDIEFVSSDWAISKADAPEGFYIIFNEEDPHSKPQVIKNYSVADFNEGNQTQRNASDKIAVVSASTRFQSNTGVNVLAKHELSPLVPTPMFYEVATGDFVMNASVKISAPKALQEEQSYLESLLETLPKITVNTTAAKKIVLTLGNIRHGNAVLTKGSAAYELTVNSSSVQIKGADPTGVFYAIQSLHALMPLSFLQDKNATVSIPAIHIIDYPRFSYRGVHIDVARNFQKKETILKMLDLMAFYKLNKLHFHVADDEGWRVEIKSLPELTQVGAFRGHDKTGEGMVPSFGSGPFADASNSFGSGFYSSSDFIEILRYAKNRHIEIIPKVDMPGHARAAIKSMKMRYEKLNKEGRTKEAEQYLLHDPDDSSVYRSVQRWNDNVMCVCQESTYNFISTVVKGFRELYADAKVPLTTFHIGADEVPHGVWEKSPRCKELLDSLNLPFENLEHHFYKRVSDILKSENLNMGGWEEIALLKKRDGNQVELVANPEFVNENFKPYVWNSVWGGDQEDVGYKLANAGYQVVLSNVTNLYFDLAYEKHPDEPGYYWGAFVDTKKVFEFNPFNIYQDVKVDKQGNELKLEAIAGKARLSESGSGNIRGIQGQLWAESIRGQQQLEYMAFPKLLALSERAWNGTPVWANIKDEKERNKSRVNSWLKFANTIGQSELPRLDLLYGGVNYRISPPGAEINNGVLMANIEFPGLTIRYTTDGSEPSSNSLIYNGPVEVNGSIVKLKSFNSANRSSRTVVVQ